MKKALLTLVVLAAIGGSVYAFYTYRATTPAPTVTTALVTRGDIADTVGATGALQAVTTVQVGSQVSGSVRALYADFNSLVRKGQILAELDPSLLATQIDQASANLIRAQADLERLRVTLEDARTKLARARELAAKQLIAQTELDTAEVAVRSTEAQIRSSQASVTQAEASLNQNKVNLQHTVITAPIDGLVISRNVDVGQTVAASMNAPVLFVLAADLTKMQVVANLDESDVGRIRPGQPVTFQVDAYPAEDFHGSVVQVRLQPIVQQNVVTYATVIDVPNPELKLKPGMTANVNVEIARRSSVLRVPNTALRFRPTNEIFAALGQQPPGAEPRGQVASDGPSNGTGRGDALPQAPPPAPATAAAASPAPREGSAAPSRGVAGAGRGNGVSIESRGADAAGRSRGRGLQNLTPEERQAVIAQMRGRGSDAASGAGRGTRSDTAAPAPAPSARPPGATTFDALFGPLPSVESRGQVWQHVNGALKPLRVRLGITDGQATELLGGDLTEGTELVTNVQTGAETRPTPAGIGGFSPFMGPQRGQGGGGGGNRGNGGGGGEDRHADRAPTAECDRC